MVIHAESKQQKKVISMHICTGMVCKNCVDYSKSKLFPDRGYCQRFNQPGLSYNDFCSLFRRRVEILHQSNGNRLTESFKAY